MLPPAFAAAGIPEVWLVDLTLEELGLAADPVNQRLIPVPGS